MPDVFKILKDLELKAVGLDPETNKMQEGYFVSFREIGLPIHKQDFDKPWSPLGANLDKDIPKTNPADPKDAPKTGSAGLDEDKALTASIGNSQQAYLNAFLLTDDKLRMNNQYSVIPGSCKVSDSWWAVITGANGIPTTTVLNDSMKKAYEEAQAKLMDQDGNMTPHYNAYLERQEEYRKKLKDWHRAYAASLTDPMKKQSWPIEGVTYHDETDEAWDRWVAFGHKEEIENAIATLAAQGTDPAIALISRAQKRFTNSLNEFQSVGQIPYTILLPNSWYDRDIEEGWYEYNSADFHSESHYQASSTSYSGSTKLGLPSLFTFNGKGSFKKMENQRSFSSQMDNLEITFKYCIVDIKRPWLDASLLNLSNWFLMGDYKKGSVSNGTMAQELPENALQGEHAFLPSIVTSLILTKDVSIKWTNWQQDWKSATESMDANASIGFWLWAAKSSYSHRGQQRDITVDSEKESLEIPGISLIGYVSTINPSAPAHDSSEFVVTKPA
jgi:hypothetical protein